MRCDFQPKGQPDGPVGVHGRDFFVRQGQGDRTARRKREKGPPLASPRISPNLIRSEVRASHINITRVTCT